MVMVNGRLYLYGGFSQKVYEDMMTFNLTSGSYQWSSHHVEIAYKKP